jgi:hypothetical protein
MKTKLFILVFIFAVVMSMGLMGQKIQKQVPYCCAVKTKTIVIYDNHEIPAQIGISTGKYTKVDGYRYANIAVEFEQKTSGEKPLSLVVVFAHDVSGKWGARRYFTFEENFSAPAVPQNMTVTGEGCWHGSPHNKSSYIVRVPIMGPFIQVFPFNNHSEKRKFSIVIYLTN